MKKINHLMPILYLLALLWLAACTPNNQSTPIPLVTDTLPEPTATLSPTDTPEPGVIVLLAGSGADTGQLGQVTPLLQTLAGERGLRFEQLENFAPESAPPGLRMVVALPPLTDLAGLAAALPETQFVTVGVENVQPTSNLTVVGGGGDQAIQAFMAGYIAAVQSSDWRVGILSLNNENGRIYRDAFINGVAYYCGTCASEFPPYTSYPVFAEVGPGAGADAFQQAADLLLAASVEIVHVSPGLDAASVYQYMAQRNVRFVGADAPPAGLEGSWYASVVLQPQMNLEQVLALVLDSGSQGTVSSGVQIAYSGVSQARMEHFYKILARLETGEIDPVGTVNN